MYAGRNIRNQLSAYLFNREAVEEYLVSVKVGHSIAPPEIMIETSFLILYIYKNSCSSLFPVVPLSLCSYTQKIPLAYLFPFFLACLIFKVLF